MAAVAVSNDDTAVALVTMENVASVPEVLPRNIIGNCCFRTEQSPAS